jgi:hypothetical protein
MFVINSRNNGATDFIVPNEYRSLAVDLRGNAHWSEYNGSLLNIRDNLQLFWAWYPLYLNGFVPIIKTRKPNYQSLEQFKESFEHYKNILTNSRDTTHMYTYPTESDTYKCVNLIIVNLDGTHDSQDCFNWLDLQLENNRMLNAAAMLNAGNRIRIYIHQETRRVVVFTDVLNPGFLLKLTSVLPAAMTALNPEMNNFNYNFPASLFMSLNALQYNDYKTAFSDWYYPLQETIRQQQMLCTITEFFRIRHTAEEEHIRNTTATIRQEISNYEEALRTRYITLKDLERKTMYYLTHDVNELIAEFIEYVSIKLKNKKDIINIQYNGSSIIFEVVVPLSIFAVDEVDRLYHSERENYMNDSRVMRLISKHVLLNQEYQIIFQQNFKLNFADKTISCAYTEYITQQGMPNPHIQEFQCWGNNKSAITKALVESNLIIALEQAITAIRSINVADSVVIRRLKDKLLSGATNYYTTPAFKNMETGELLTFEQFAHQIEERENNNVETNQPELILTDDEGAVPTQF